MADVTIEGIPALKAALARKVKELHAASTTAVAEEVDLIRRDAVKEAPQDTGDLRRKIRGESDGLKGTVRSTARHAGFVEHGTFKDKAQPYMAPAADRARRRFPKRATDIIRKALGG